MIVSKTIKNIRLKKLICARVLLWHEQIPFSWRSPSASRQVCIHFQPDSSLCESNQKAWQCCCAFMCCGDVQIYDCPTRKSLLKCTVAWKKGKFPVGPVLAEWQNTHLHQSSWQHLYVSDCSLTEGAAFVLCAFHGAIRQHLEVEAVSAVKSCDDALQLGLCRANTGLNTH